MSFSPVSIAMAAPAVRPGFEAGAAPGMRLNIPPLPGSARATQITPGQGSPAVTQTAAAFPPVTAARTPAAATPNAPLSLSIPPLPGSAAALAARQQPPAVAGIGVTGTAGTGSTPVIPAEQLVVIPASANPPPATAPAGGLSIPPLPGSARALETVSATAVPAPSSAPAPVVTIGAEAGDLVAPTGVPLPPVRPEPGREDTAADQTVTAPAANGLPQLSLSIPPLQGLTVSGAQPVGTTEALRQYADAEAAMRDPGLTTDDMIDMVNPLQHLPLVSIAYREMTGDEIRPHARIIGGGLYGGWTGLASSFANVAVEGETGKDIGEHVWDGLFGSGDPTPVDPATQQVIIASRQVDMSDYGTPQLAMAPLPGADPLNAGEGQQFAAAPTPAAPIFTIGAEDQGPTTAAPTGAVPIPGSLDAALSRLAASTPAVAAGAPTASSIASASATAPTPATPGAGSILAGNGAPASTTATAGLTATASAAGIAPTNLLTSPAPLPPEPAAVVPGPGPEAEWFDLPIQSGPPRSLTATPPATSAPAVVSAAPAPEPTVTTVAAAPPAQTPVAAAPQPAGPIRAAGNPDVIVPFAPPPLVGTLEDAPAGYVAPPNPNDVQDIDNALDAALMRLAGGGPAPASPAPASPAAAPAPSLVPQQTVTAPISPADLALTANPAVSAGQPSGLVNTSVGEVPAAMVEALARYQAMQDGQAAALGAAVDNQG